MLVFFSVALLILTLFIMPFVVSVEAEFDVIKNEGMLRVRLFIFTVFKRKLSISSEQIVDMISNAINSRGEDKRIGKIVFALLKNINVGSAALEMRVGKADDAFQTAMAFSFLQIVASSLLQFIRCRYNASVSQHFCPSFNENEFALAFDGIISINIADIILSLITHFFAQRRRRPSSGYFAKGL